MLNQATIMGRVGKMDSKTSSTGVVITNISMVTSKKFMKDGQKQEKAIWHNVKCFSKLADIANSYVNVGDVLLIQGEIDNQKYTTKEGQERISNCIIASNIHLIPKSKEQAPKATPKESFDEGLDFQDIPF